VCFAFFYVRVQFGLIDNAQALNDRIKLLPGVVEVGLFCGMAEKAFFGQADGSFTTRVTSQ
jgi:ribose 5-phosphate isomerase A